MMQRKDFNLYLLVLGLMIFVVIAALGGGLFGQRQPWMLQWQHQAFASLCHQMPGRSFWINDQPMAVCSRCFGIYAGFLSGWLLLPLVSWIAKKITDHAKTLLLTSFLINVIDVIGNVLHFWQNTLVSRVVLGGLMGLAAAMLFSGAFFTQITTQKQEYYGRITTAGTGG